MDLKHKHTNKENSAGSNTDHERNKNGPTTQTSENHLLASCPQQNFSISLSAEE